MEAARPYLAAFRARFQLMLQYRAAALAGFATQLWWGAIRILVFAAFYGVNAAAAPISFADAVTYVWLGQALLALQPWIADPGDRPGRAHRRRRLRPAAAARRLRLLVCAQRGLDAGPRPAARGADGAGGGHRAAAGRALGTGRGGRRPA